MSLCQCLNAPLFEGTRSVLTMQAPALSRIDSNLIIGHGHDIFFSGGFEIVCQTDSFVSPSDRVQ